MSSLNILLIQAAAVSTRLAQFLQPLYFREITQDVIHLHHAIHRTTVRVKEPLADPHAVQLPYDILRDISIYRLAEGFCWVCITISHVCDNAVSRYLLCREF